LKKLLKVLLDAKKNGGTGEVGEKGGAKELDTELGEDE